jgi:hypothetical protein
VSKHNAKSMQKLSTKHNFMMLSLTTAHTAQKCQVVIFFKSQLILTPTAVLFELITTLGVMIFLKRRKMKKIVPREGSKCLE